MQKKNIEKRSIRSVRSGQTQQSILAAAEKVFSQLGFYGARIDEIAAEAGVNKRMIYEYFGNKESLYKLTLERVYLRLNDCEEGIIRCADNLDAAEAIVSLTRIYFRFNLENPSYVRMVMWENLNDARYFIEQNMQDIRNPIKKALHSIIANGQAQGLFRENLDESQILMSLFSGPFNYFSNAHTMQLIMHKDFFSEAEVSARADFVAETLLAYLRKRPS